ncbi:hypothetical protein V500_00984 [Pseudogymnoascus sp. VKM F-4518 (FW-2643)]|nr:hypothetical protein V500_00984 [Pseudogymnoascus sp. VKM F-4518 (FW-2643)]
MSSAFIPGQPPYRMQLLGGGSQIHPVPNQQAEVLRPLPRVDPNSMEELLNNQINTIMQMLHKEVEAHNNTRAQLHTYVQSKLHWERWFRKNDIENQYLHGVIQDLRTKNQEEKIKQFIGQEEGLNALQESFHNGLPALLEGSMFDNESDTYSPRLQRQKRQEEFPNPRPKRSRALPNPATPSGASVEEYTL